MPSAPPGTYGKPPGGGTAIASGVLAVIGAVVFLTIFLLILSAALKADDISDEDTIWLIVAVVTFPAVTLLLGVGGVLLFVKKKAGRLMVALGCVLAVLMVAVAGFMTVNAGMAQDPAPARFVGTIGVVFLGAVMAVPAIVTLCLVMIAPTNEYLEFHARAGAGGSSVARR